MKNLRGPTGTPLDPAGPDGPLGPGSPCRRKNIDNVVSQQAMTYTYFSCHALYDRWHLASVTWYSPKLYFLTFSPLGPLGPGGPRGPGRPCCRKKPGLGNYFITVAWCHEYSRQCLYLIGHALQSHNAEPHLCTTCSIWSTNKWFPKTE